MTCPRAVSCQTKEDTANWGLNPNSRAVETSGGSHAGHFGKALAGLRCPETAGSAITASSAPSVGPGKPQPRTRYAESNPGPTSISIPFPFPGHTLPTSDLTQVLPTTAHSPRCALWLDPHPFPTILNLSQALRPYPNIISPITGLAVPFAYNYNNNWGMS